MKLAVEPVPLGEHFVMLPCLSDGPAALPRRQAPKEGLRFAKCQQKVRQMLQCLLCKRCTCVATDTFQFLARAGAKDSAM